MCIVSHGYDGMEAEMVLVVGKHAKQSQERLVLVTRCRSNSRVRGVDIDHTNHTAFHVRSSGLGRAGIDLSSGEDLNTP